MTRYEYSTVSAETHKINEALNKYYDDGWYEYGKALLLENNGITWMIIPVRRRVPTPGILQRLKKYLNEEKRC